MDVTNAERLLKKQKKKKGESHAHSVDGIISVAKNKNNNMNLQLKVYRVGTILRYRVSNLQIEMHRDR